MKGNLGSACRRTRAADKQAGFTLIETLMGAFIFSVLGLVLVQFVAVNAALLTASARQRDADAQATGGINRIVALKPADDTQSLDWGDGKTVRLRTLVAGYYDYVVVPHPGEKTELPQGCNGWPCAVPPDQQPPGTDILFVRAWTVSTADTLRNIHQVRIGVFPSAAAPLGGGKLGGAKSGAAEDAEVGIKPAPGIGPMPPTLDAPEAIAAREGFVTFR